MERRTFISACALLATLSGAALAAPGATAQPGVTAQPGATLQVARASRGLMAQLPAPAVRDIALLDRNTLHGQVVDREGMAQANYEVWLARENGPILKTRTDAAGRFIVPELDAGTYRIDTAAGGGKFRLWEGKKAPLSAPSNVLLVVATRGAS